MTPSLLIRPVLAILLTAGLSACGMVDSDPHRFENMADQVAAIRLDGGTDAARPARGVREAGLRPAIQPVRVEVMDPHALWDARDGLVEQAASKAVDAAAPAVADAVVQRVSARADAAMAQAGLRPAVRPVAVQTPPRVPRMSNGLVQLGAYSSEASARAAWARLKDGEAAWALAGLSPVFEGVEVNGRRLTRLKVQAPTAGAAAVCAAAGIDDPWCRRAA